MRDAGGPGEEAYLVEDSRHLYIWKILRLSLDAYNDHARWCLAQVSEVCSARYPEPSGGAQSGKAERSGSERSPLPTLIMEVTIWESLHRRTGSDAEKAWYRIAGTRLCIFRHGGRRIRGKAEHGGTLGSF